MAAQASRRSFAEHFVVEKFLGQGDSCQVYLGHNRQDPSAKVAIKVIDKLWLSQSELQQTVLHEMVVQRQLEHPNVLRVLDVLEDDRNHYIVLPYCEKGSLASYLKAQPTQTLAESVAKDMIRQLASALRYLHEDQKLLHRDLKLSNVLLTEEMIVQLSDFGLAIHISEHPQTVCGTPNFMAPEILLEENTDGYDQAVDLWSLGCVMYHLLVGKPPFEGRKVSETLDNITSDEYQVHLPSHLSSSACDLIGKLLKRDPTKRFSATQVLRHPWIKQQQAVQADIPQETEKPNQTRVKKKKKKEVLKSKQRVTPSTRTNEPKAHSTRRRSKTPPSAKRLSLSRRIDFDWDSSSLNDEVSEEDDDEGEADGEEDDEQIDDEEEETLVKELMEFASVWDHEKGMATSAFPNGQQEIQRGEGDAFEEQGWREEATHRRSDDEPAKGQVTLCSTLDSLPVLGIRQPETLEWTFERGSPQLYKMGVSNGIQVTYSPLEKRLEGVLTQGAWFCCEFGSGWSTSLELTPSNSTSGVAIGPSSLSSRQRIEVMVLTKLVHFLSFKSVMLLSSPSNHLGVDPNAPTRLNLVIPSRVVRSIQHMGQMHDQLVQETQPAKILRGQMDPVSGDLQVWFDDGSQVVLSGTASVLRQTKDHMETQFALKKKANLPEEIKQKLMQIAEWIPLLQHSEEEEEDEEDQAEEEEEEEVDATS